MPIIKSAFKKVRVDQRRRAHNLKLERGLKTSLKKARASKKFADVSAAYSALDRAVKDKLIHRNFANRQKAQLARLAKPVKLVREVVKTKKLKNPTKSPARPKLKRS